MGGCATLFAPPLRSVILTSTFLSMLACIRPLISMRITWSSVSWHVTTTELVETQRREHLTTLQCGSKLDRYSSIVCFSSTFLLSCANSYIGMSVSFTAMIIIATRARHGKRTWYSILLHTEDNSKYHRFLEARHSLFIMFLQMMAPLDMVQLESWNSTNRAKWVRIIFAFYKGEIPKVLTGCVGWRTLEGIFLNSPARRGHSFRRPNSF